MQDHHDHDIRTLESRLRALTCETPETEAMVHAVMDRLPDAPPSPALEWRARIGRLWKRLAAPPAHSADAPLWAACFFAVTGLYFALLAAGCALLQASPALSGHPLAEALRIQLTFCIILGSTFMLLGLFIKYDLDRVGPIAQLFSLGAAGAAVAGGVALHGALGGASPAFVAFVCALQSALALLPALAVQTVRPARGLLRRASIVRNTNLESPS
jgi:hypothetical protein